jgi:thiol-disulfide isomerase/thioredoxin
MNQSSRRSFLAAASAAGVALAAPNAPLRKMPKDFYITLISGQRVTFDAFAGKVVAVELLLTTCPHCQRCAQTMQKLVEELGPKGFAALGAAVDDNARMNMLSFQMKSGARFPIGVADKVEAYRVIGSDPSQLIYFPQLVFVDRTGAIRAHYGGTDNFFLEEEKNARAQILSLLGEVPGGRK